MSTKFLPPMALIPLVGMRRPFTSTSVSRLRSWICDPPAVFWLLLLALLLPVLLRPAKEGTALRSSSSAFELTPVASISFTPRTVTGTAASLGVVGMLEPVTVIVSTVLGSSFFAWACASIGAATPAAIPDQKAMRTAALRVFGFMAFSLL